MNQTTDGSKQRAIIVGGDTFVTENGMLEIPPEQAKNFTPVLNNIEKGEEIVISTGNCKIEDVLSKEQIEEFKKAKESQPKKAQKDEEQR